MQKKIETCNRCGRRLKTSKSIELGFGPVCHKKYLREKSEAEFLKNQITIDEIEKGHIS